MREGIQAAALLAQIATAMLFVWAGASKFAQPGPIRTTIAALKMAWSPALALALASCEIAAGLALLLLPGRWLTAILISALACLFSAAALFATIRHLHVECACFGSSRSALLGWRQLALLPAWLAVAASVIGIPPVLIEDRLALTFTALAILAGRALWSLMPLFAEHRAQWIAIDGS
jgi:hypothetical protein